MIIYHLYTKLMQKQLSCVILYGIIFSLFFYLFTNADVKSNDFNREQVKVAFFQEEDDAFIHGLKEYLGQYCDFVEIPENHFEQFDTLFDKEVDCMIMVPLEFTTRFLDDNINEIEFILYENTNKTVYIQQALEHYLTISFSIHQQEPSLNEVELVDRVKENLTSNLQIRKETSAEMKQTSQGCWEYNLLGFVLTACMITICASGLLSFNSPKMHMRNIVAPITEKSMFIQLLLGNLSYTSLYTLLFLLLAALMRNQQEMTLSLLLYWVNTFIFILPIILFSYYMSSRLKSKITIYTFANSFALIISFLSGVFVNQKYISATVLKIGCYFPVYWFVRGNECINEMTKITGKGLLQLLEILGIQVAFAITFFLVILVNSKVESEEK